LKQDSRGGERKSSYELSELEVKVIEVLKRYSNGTTSLRSKGERFEEGDTLFRESDLLNQPYMAEPPMGGLSSQAKHGIQ
jgi:hypothetical protein